MPQRRPGAVTELLFLFECTARDTQGLKPIANRLGLTIQATSHVFRQLARAGRVQARGGHYVPTVAGVDWLHRQLEALRDDLVEKWTHLDVIRTTRALAHEPLRRGDQVALDLRHGRLTASRGQGPSQGTVLAPARPGDLVEVGSLRGIVPVRAGTVHVLTFEEADVRRRGILLSLRRTLPAGDAGLLAAGGLEAEYLLHRATRRPFLRFGVAAASMEAARVGVDSTVVVGERELPRLLGQFEGPNPPRLRVRPLG